MLTIPSRPAHRQFDYPKLAVSATMASPRDVGFFFDKDYNIGGMVFACVTDIQGNALPPDHLPPPQNFKLFEIVAGVGIKEVTSFEPLGPGLPANVGALKQVVFQFLFQHTPDITDPLQGEVRQVPFMLLVSPAGMFAPFEKLAGFTLLSATALVPYYQ
jgi:hypothetical protein